MLFRPSFYSGWVHVACRQRDRPDALVVVWSGNEARHGSRNVSLHRLRMSAYARHLLFTARLHDSCLHPSKKNVAYTSTHWSSHHSGAKTHKHKLFGCATSVMMFIAFQLVAVSLHTLLRGLMILSATRSSSCTIASTVLRRTSGNT